jgi:outer membrane protein assembly factor BamB
MTIRWTTVAGFAALLACAPPPATLQLFTSESPQPQPRSLFRLDWRTRVRGDTVEEPPLSVEMMRWAPQETAAPTVVSSEQEVVVGSTSGSISAFGFDGRLLWRFATHGPITTSATYAEGSLFISSADGSIYALDPRTGIQRWAHDLGEEPASSPVIAGGLVYVATHQESLFAIDAASGARRWHYRREQLRPFTLRNVATPRPAGDLVFTGFSDGTTLALKADDGTVVWQRSAGPGDQFVDADASPQVAGSRVYVASFRDGISSVERSRGDLVWHKPFPGATGLLLADGILFATAIGKVAAFSPGDGTPLWEMGLGDRTPGLLRLMGPVLMVPTSDSLLFLDDHTGARLGSAFSPGRGVDAAAAAAGREVYVLSNAGWLYALGLM